MTSESVPNRKTSELRRRAVERVAEHIRTVVSRIGHDTHRMLQEMERYNIELELQIEGLRQDKVELELNYDNLYDSAPVGYFTLGCNGEIEIANLTGAGMLGQPRAAVLSQPFSAYVSVDSLPGFKEFFRRVMEGNQRESCLVTLMRRGNTPVSAYIEATGAGPGSSFRAVVLDITSAEQSSLALRARKAHPDMALTASSMGVWEWERDTGDVYWSQECIEIFGIDSNCPSLEAVAQLLHPEDAPRVRSIARNVLAESKAQTVECRIIRPNGEVIWILAHGQVHLNSDGEPLRLLGIVQDITDRKRAE